MEQSNYSKIFKALSNEQRLKIFMMIYKQCRSSEERQGASELTISDEGACCPVKGAVEKAFTKICECMNISRSTVSHHFKELQNAGLISCERQGQAFRCTVNKEAIDSIKKFFE